MGTWGRGAAWSSRPRIEQLLGDAMTLEELRYPTGKWIKVPNMDAAARAERIEQIAGVPAALGAAVKGLTDAQFDTPYRDGGWSTRQIVHHLADSHMNAFIRVKLG